MQLLITYIIYEWISNTTVEKTQTVVIDKWIRISDFLRTIIFWIVKSLINYAKGLNE